MRKSILLAGGMGTRLHPATGVLNKHLLSVYDKPMFYYPLSVLMLTGIQDYCRHLDAVSIEHYRAILSKIRRVGPEDRFRGAGAACRNCRGVSSGGAGDRWPLHLSRSGRQHFLLVWVLVRRLSGLAADSGATIFSYPVRDPGRFGLVEVDAAGRPLSLEEKPVRPKSNLAVPGLYFHDEKVTDITRGLKPSERGELEITDVNRAYSCPRRGRRCGRLDVVPPGSMPAIARALLDASNFVASVERRQGLKIGCIEEIAWRNRWIDDTQLLRLAAAMPACEYRDYIQSVAATGPAGVVTRVNTPFIPLNRPALVGRKA